RRAARPAPQRAGSRPVAAPRPARPRGAPRPAPRGVRSASAARQPTSGAPTDRTRPLAHRESGHAQHGATLFGVALGGGPGGEAITAREAEVLDALGENLTNAEIAERLFISVRTVESHVSALLRKLGRTDRRQLAELGGRVA